MTAVPSAIFVSILADAATYSAGALLMSCKSSQLYYPVPHMDALILSVFSVAYNTSLPVPSHEPSQKSHLTAHAPSFLLPSFHTNTQIPE